MKTALKKSVATGALLLAGATFAFAGDAKGVADSVGLGVQFFLFFWIASSVILMAIYGRKWLKAYNELPLPKVAPSRDGELASGEPDPVENLRSSCVNHCHKFTDVDGEEYVCFDSYKEAMQMRSEIVRFLSGSPSLTENQASTLNDVIEVCNASLKRIDGRVFLSKAAKVIVWIYWGLLILGLVMMLVQAFSFTSYKWDWNIFFMGVIGVPINAYCLWQFFLATRIAYQIPFCSYEQYRASWPVRFYDKAWIWLTASTASGAAAGLAYSATSDVTVYRDSEGRTWKSETSNFGAGMCLMCVALMLGFMCGGFLFFVVQPILMMWLFKKHFIDCEEDPGPTAPIWRRPKFPIWASLVCGGAIGLLVMTSSLVDLMMRSSSDATASEKTKTEQVEKTAATPADDDAKKTAPAAETPESEEPAKADPETAETLKQAYADEQLVWREGDSRELLAFARAVRHLEFGDAAALVEATPQLAKVTIQDHSDVQTTLVFASRWGVRTNDEVAVLALLKRLLAAGADVNAVSEKGQTALSYAARHKRYETARVLVAAGATAEYAYKGRKTSVRPLVRDDEKMAAILPPEPAATSTPAREMRSQSPATSSASGPATPEALAAAVASSNVAETKRILAAGVKPSDDVMYAAVRKNNADVLAALLAHGGNANAKHGETPILFYCPYRGNITCAKLLVDAGADTNFTVRISGKIPYRTFLKNRKGTELLAYIEQKTGVR
ncbi:MAG: ankyrin repeat domain-containing protein [Candidatus Spyradosoma sp.]